MNRQWLGGREIFPQGTALGAVWALWLTLAALGCGEPGRDNPFDPGAAEPPTAAVALRIPLPKALVTIVDRVEAVLEGPGMLPVLKVLEHGPTGPAVGTIGAVPPGTDRVLTVQGFDLDGRLLLRGQTRGIAILDGDTTRVSLDLFLVAGEDDAGPADEAGDEEPVDTGGAVEEGTSDPGGDATAGAGDSGSGAPEENDGTNGAATAGNGGDPAADGTEDGTAEEAGGADAGDSAAGADDGAATADGDPADGG